MRGFAGRGGGRYWLREENPCGYHSLWDLALGGGLGRGDSGGRTLGGLATKGRGDSTYLGGLLPNCWTVMENTVRASVRIVF